MKKTHKILLSALLFIMILATWTLVNLVVLSQHPVIETIAAMPTT